MLHGNQSYPWEYPRDVAAAAWAILPLARPAATQAITQEADSGARFRGSGIGLIRRPEDLALLVAVGLGTVP